MTVYKPHSSKTRVPYGELLALLKRTVAFGIDDSVQEVATEVLEVVRRPDVTDAERKKALDNLFGPGIRLTDEAAQQIIAVAAQLDDFVPSGKNRPRAASDDDGSDSSDDDVESMDEAENEEAMAKALEGLNFDQDTGVADESDDDAGPLSFDDIDEHYLSTNIGKLMPYLAPGDARLRAAKVYEALADESNPDTVVSTQLLMTLDAWSEPTVQAWANRVISSRWAVVYAIQRATQHLSRDDIIRRVRDHAARDQAVLSLLATLVGGVVKQADQDKASTGGVRRPAEMEILDLQQFAFEEGSKLNVRRGKLVVPLGTQRHSYETHEEIVVPQQTLYNGDQPLVGLHEFAPWARSAFPKSVLRLNPMQSRVFPAAYHTNSNLLICAPTGAGKTNVAMTAILRELAKWRDEENQSFHFDLFKMVYVAPMKALVQEVVRTFGERLQDLGIKVAELSGDQGLSKAELEEVQLIVTTPEKWDVVTRKGMDRGAAALVKLIIIDEIHLLHSDRGPVLEAIIARSRQHATNGGGEIRLVGLSATLPNYEDVATFLGITEKSKGLLHFDATFRPVPLRQTFAGVKKTKRAAGRASTLNQVAYDYAKNFVTQQLGVLMFVHGRKDAIATAELIKKLATDQGIDRYFARPNTPMAGRLRDAAASVRHPALKGLLEFGVGFHHAGVCREDREIVEQLFLDRDLLCLVCTATLAWGVNLPARGVIIKGTKVVNAARGGFDDLSPLDVFQMFGRAGRPGHDVFGEAVIITGIDDLEYYISLLNQQLPIESRLMNRLVDSINAEVVLGNISGVDDAVRWLEWTYLHVRMQRSPKLYGISPELVRRDPTLREHRENLAHTALTLLHSRKLARYDTRQGDVSSLELGRIASHYYLTEKSVEVYSRLLKHDIDDVDLFRAFSLSSEFEKIACRDDEISELRRLSQVCPIPIRDPIDKACTKINILLQAYISNQRLEGLALSSELAYVKDSATRIARALLDIAMDQRLAATARRVIRLYNEVCRQQWSAFSPLRQFNEPSLDGVIRRMEGRRLDWETIHLFAVEDGQFDEFAPSDLQLQHHAHRYVHCIPRLHFENTALIPLSPSTCKAEITLVVDFEYDKSIHGPVLEAFITIEDGDGVKLLHREHVYLTTAMLTSGTPLVVTALLQVADPTPTHYFARAQFLGWLGTEVSCPLSLIGLTLPAPAKTPLIPQVESGLDLQELNDAWLDGFFVSELATFTPTQSHMFEQLYRHPGHAYIGLPHGSGRTVATELFLLRALRDVPQGQTQTTVYLHPGQLTLQRRQQAWTTKFESAKAFDPDLHKEVIVVTLPPPYHRLPEDAAVMVRDAQRQVASAGGGLVVVLTTPFVWRGVLTRRKEFVDVLNAVTNVVADGLQWLGEAQAPASLFSPELTPPVLFGNKASFGATYEGVLFRLLELNRERTKANAAPMNILLHCTPTLQAKEICDWVKVPEERRFDFAASAAVQRIVLVEPSEHGGRSAEALPSEQRVLRLLAQPKYEVSRVAVVVPSRVHVVSLAVLIADTLRDKPLAPYPNVRDKTLARLLPTGVAFVDEGMSASDVAIVRERLLDPKKAPPGIATLPRYLPEGQDQQLVVVLSPAAVEHFASNDFDLLIVAGTAVHSTVPKTYATLPSPETIDVSRNTMLFIVSRAAVSSTIICSAASLDYWRPVVTQPVVLLPALDTGRGPVRMPVMQPDAGILTDAEKVEGPYRTVAWQYLDEVLTRVLEGAITNMDQLVRYLAGSLLGRCLRNNPAAYGLNDGGDSAEARGEFFSAVAEVLIKALEADLHCVTHSEETLTVKPTLLGAMIGRYRIPCTSLKSVIDMRAQGSIHDLVLALCHAPFVQSMCPFFERTDRYPQLRSRRATTTPTKAAALVSSWLARETLHSALETEMKRVIPVVTILALAAVEVLSKLHWPLGRSTMGLVQLLVQRSEDASSRLLQIPHFTQATVDQAAVVAPALQNPEDLAELDDEVRSKLFEHFFSESQVEDIAEWSNNVPLVDLAATSAAGPQGETIVQVCVTTSLVDENATTVPDVPTPHWVAPTRRAKWWFAVVNSAGELLGLRYVPLVKLFEQLSMRVDANKESAPLRVLAISDTYRMELQTDVKSA